MKNNTWLFIIIGIVGAVLLYLFTKSTAQTVESPLGIVGASTTSPVGSNSGILTPTLAVSAVNTGLSSLTSLLSGEESDLSSDYGTSASDLSDLDVSDDLDYED
jgi:hypothetical protein